MKSYEEMAACVFQRSSEILTAKKQRRKNIYKAATALSCLCLVFFVAIGIWQNQVSQENPPVKGFFDANNPDVSNPDASDTFIVNTLEPSVMTSADMDVQYNSYEKLPYDVWQTVISKFQDFTGIAFDDFNARLPETFDWNFYSLSTRGYKDDGLPDEYKIHDYVFEGFKNPGSEHEKHAVVALCPTEAPLRDCIIVSEDEDNIKPSNINGVQVTILQCNATYLCTFSHQGINYDIETQNLNPEELKELLTGILGA
ncbi:MAG: hypothetical protein HFE73_05010 [Firmicutes bacterium]|nr:hypothetical protein [Bacillota bacterium]